MKRYNSLLSFKWLTALLLVVCFVSCADEDVESSSSVKEGVPVQIKMDLSVSGMDVITSRSLTEEQEYNMYDLYVLIFDKDKNVKFRKYATVEELNHTGNNPTFGSLSITTTSGESYIYGIANVKTNEMKAGSTDLFEQLEGVSNLADLQKVEAVLAVSGNIERNQASLVMSGTFEGTDATAQQKEEGYCVIPATDNAVLSGKIYLKRLDSHITFNVKLDNSNIISFIPGSWKVYNVPTKSYLTAQESDAATAASDYVDAHEFINFQDDNNGKYSFDFYMLENRKESKAYDGKTITTYSEREEEVKNPISHSDKNGQTEYNTGEYKYVEPYATFVEIKAKMTIDQGEGNTRFADVRYIIHLGYVDSNPADFKSLRNTKYTYNVTIKDVNNIVLEVTTGEEKQSGAEGDVIDAQEKVIPLDCHYHTFVLGFTKAQMELFKFQVKTPFTTYSHETAGVSGEDLTWIQFKRNKDNSSSNLALHKDETDAKLLTLFELAKDVEKQSGEDFKIFYYTVFVKEFFYDDMPVGQNWQKPYWRYFVNQPNRYAMLIYSPQYSQDGDSSYAKARYLISQSSIQTYYSTTNLNSAKTALGVEHVNETGKPTWGARWNQSLSDVDGYSNVWGYLSSFPSLRNYMEVNLSYGNIITSYEADAKNYTYKMSSAAVALADCLARNRDENGDGVISKEELKWYLPTTKQMVEIFLGAESLVTPLFDADSHATIETGNKGKYHYMSSNGEMLWAEEGCSGAGSTWHFKDENDKPQEIRCVRNLADSPSTLAGKVYERVDASGKKDENGNAVSVAYLEGQSIRTGYIKNGELPYHNNFSRTNLPYESFIVAKEPVARKENWSDYFFKSNGDLYNKQGTDYTGMGTGISSCADYSEKSDKSDRGKWRAPNQRELAYMFLTNLSWANDNGGGEYSITHWKYDVTRHLGVSLGVALYLDTWIRNSSGGNGKSALRCIRDNYKE